MHKLAVPPTQGVKNGEPVKGVDQAQKAADNFGKKLIFSICLAPNKSAERDLKEIN